MLWLERGLSDNTISSYRTDLYKLNDWLDSKASSYLTLDTLLLHNHLAWRIDQGFQATHRALTQCAAPFLPIFNSRSSYGPMTRPWR